MRPQPAIRDIAYSFRSAVAADAFIQFPLLTSKFTRDFDEVFAPKGSA